MSGKGDGKVPKALDAVLAQFRSSQAAAGRLLGDAARARAAAARAPPKPGAARPPKKPAAARGRGRAGGAPAPTGPSRSAGSGDGAPGGSGGSSEAWRATVLAPAVPLGLRQKRVLEFLRAAEGEPRSCAEVAAATGADPAADADLAAALGANPKAATDDGGATWRYVPDAAVRDRAALLELIRRSPAPVAFSEVADAYAAVGADVAALKAEGLVLGLHSHDPAVACEVLFPVDVRLAGAAAVDADVAAVWHRTEAPDGDEELAAELRRAGMRPAPRKAPAKRADKEKAKERRRRRQLRLRSVTNQHLVEMFAGEVAASID